jgi:hypothetical protein
MWLNICAFPRILGSPASLQLIPSEFPYIYEEIFFSFLSVYSLSHLYLVWLVEALPILASWWVGCNGVGTNAKQIAMVCFI